MNYSDKLNNVIIELCVYTTFGAVASKLFEKIKIHSIGTVCFTFFPRIQILINNQ